MGNSAERKEYFFLAGIVQKFAYIQMRWKKTKEFLLFIFLEEKKKKNVVRRNVHKLLEKKRKGKTENLTVFSLRWGII
jgi:hypothetical protein